MEFDLMARPNYSGHGVLPQGGPQGENVGCLAVNDTDN